MGNCLKHQSSTKFAAADDDDCDFSAAKGAFSLATSKGGATCTTTNTNSGKTRTEVKIKITKKQLEELLGKVDIRELRVEQVLAQLMSHSRGYESLHHKSWRPALQSIPEVN